MRTSITDIFELIIESSNSFEQANEKFKNTIEQNNSVKKLYSQWCNEMGYKNRDGFIEYYYEYMKSINDNKSDIFDNCEEIYDFMITN